MTHTSSCFPGPFLTAEPQTSESSSEAPWPPQGPLGDLKEHHKAWERKAPPGPKGVQLFPPAP